ncbi:MAG: hypothetical protein KC766_38290 [Myxococcales bacterium]|nr:hypothetical protein [Myxococcales bacterium]
MRVDSAYSAALNGANRGQNRVIEAGSRLAQGAAGGGPGGPADVVGDVVELSQGAIELAANVAVIRALDESQAELLKTPT